MRWGMLAFAVIGLMGCVESATFQCGERTCPATFVCTPAGDRCVSDDAIANCVNKSDGDACEARSVPGVCLGGICEIALCGNGQVNEGEICDDGNVIGGDGCDKSCQSTEVCGNGIVDVTEGCDCGDGEPEHANSKCSRANSSDPAAPCRSDCTARLCGDGVVEASEQCEDGVALTATCQSRGFYEGTLGCNAVCQFDEVGCSKFCGDGTINGVTEACDGSPPAETCLAFGYDAGAIACSSFCAPAFDACFDIGWREFAPDSRGFSSVWGSSATDVWGGSSSGRLLHWDGVTWAERTLGLTPSVVDLIEDITGTGPSDVYAVAGLKIVHYNGTAWSLAATAPEFMVAITASGPNRVIAAGDSGALYSWNGSTWEPHTGATANLRDVHAVSTTKAYAVGFSYDVNENPFSQAYEWNGGTTWTPLAHPPMTELNAVWGTTATDLYIGGDALVHWDGTTWSTINLGVQQQVTSISGSSSSDVWVVFGNGITIAHFDGVAWSVQFAEPQQAITDVWAAGNGLAFGAGTYMTRFSGSAWADVRIKDRVAITAIGGPASGPPLAFGERGYALAYDGSKWSSLPGDVALSYTAASGSVAVGRRGTLAVYNAAGRRMDRRASGTTADLRAVWAFSDTDAWAVGDQETIVRISGTSATVVSSDPDGTSLRAMWAFGPGDIYAVGEFGVVLHYNGTSWSAVATPLPSSFHIYAIWGTPAGDLMVAGSGGTVYRRVSNTWVQDTTGTTETIHAIGGSASNELTLLTWDSIEKARSIVRFTGTFTSTSPSSSYTVSQQSANAAFKVLGVQGANIFAGGDDLALAQRFVAFGAPSFIPMVPNFDTPSNTPVLSIYASAANDVYAVIALVSIQLLHFDGQGWSLVTPSGVLARSVTGTGPNDIFVGGLDQIRHWNGTTWETHTVAAGIVSGITAMHAFSSQHAFAVAGKQVRRYTGGTAWSDTPIPVSSSLRGVWTASATEAFAVGDNGVVLQFSSGAWSQLTTPVPTSVQLTSVCGTSPTNYYVGGQFGELWHYDAGTWTRIQDLPATNINALACAAANDIFVALNGGLLYHFDGTRWTPVRTPLSENLMSLSVATTTKGTSLYVGATTPTPTIVRLDRMKPWPASP